MKEVFIIGGPNGAGKSTFVEYYLPKYINVTNFINADHIARGLSPLNSDAKAIHAGKLMFQLIDENIKRGDSFGFETTLSGQRWLDLIEQLKNSGYKVYIFFLDIDNEGLAVNRVAKRVELGGHNIPEKTIRRRFKRSKYNFWNKYKDVADKWYLFNNSDFNSPELIAQKEDNIEEILNKKYIEYFKFLIKDGN